MVTVIPYLVTFIAYLVNGYYHCLFDNCPCRIWILIAFFNCIRDDILRLFISAHILTIKFLNTSLLKWSTQMPPLLFTMWIWVLTHRIHSLFSKKIIGFRLRILVYDNRILNIVFHCFFTKKYLIMFLIRFNYFLSISFTDFYFDRTHLKTFILVS